MKIEEKLMSQGMLAPAANRLISATQVAGTAVHDVSGALLGHIDDVMIDKASGSIAYAVLSFGGFLGFGDKHHPLPWASLRYDPAKEGYVVDLDRHALHDAPAYAIGAAPLWDSVDAYYGHDLRAHDDIPLNATMPR